LFERVSPARDQFKFAQRLIYNLKLLKRSRESDTEREKREQQSNEKREEREEEKENQDQERGR
jgi:hypothetical protein